MIGPGRELLYDGFKSLINQNPNMNTLVSLGATASFSVRYERSAIFSET